MMFPSSDDDNAGTGVQHRVATGKPRRSWLTVLTGDPLATAEAPRETISKVVGLAVFASDALSSTAYSTQEMLVVLAAAGTVAFTYSIPLSLAIVALLAIVSVSYVQTIHAYPNGGGAYIVARDNLGDAPAASGGRGTAVWLHPDRRGIGLVRRGADQLVLPRALSVPGGGRRRSDRAGHADQPARRTGSRRHLRHSHLLLPGHDRDRAGGRAVPAISPAPSARSATRRRWR